MPKPAPGYVDTYQSVFAHVSAIFGYQQATEIIAANAMQDFLIRHGDISGALLLSRSSLTFRRAAK